MLMKKKKYREVDISCSDKIMFKKVAQSEGGREIHRGVHYPPGGPLFTMGDACGLRGRSLALTPWILS